MSQKTGAELIAEERARQLERLGWSAENDDAHKDGELAAAAVCYALCDEVSPTPPLMWPWIRQYWNPSEDPIRNLVRAGVLIAAEIDRLQRATNAATATGVAKPE